MSTFTVKDTVFQLKQYQVLDNRYVVDINKGSYSIDDIESILSGIYEAVIEDDGFMCGFSTENYQLTSVEDKSSYYAVSYDFMSVEAKLDAITARQDYIAIMAGIDEV